MMFDSTTSIPSHLKVKEGVSQLTDIEDQLIWAYLVVLWVISIYMNAIILLFQARNKRRLRALDYLMKNMALSNGALAFFTFPLMIISLMRHEWQFGMGGCVTYSFITTFCGEVSVWTLVGIAGLLYCRITASVDGVAIRPWKNKDLLEFDQSRYVYYVIGFLIFDYVLCFVLCLLPLVGIGQYGFGQHGTSCTIDWIYSTFSSSIYLFFLFILGYAIPLMLVVGFYVGISRCLVTFTRKYPESNNAKRWMSAQKKIIQMAVWLAISLIICWTPYTLVAVWQSFGNPETLPVRVEAAAALLAKSSTAITPMVHLWFIEKYQMFFRQIFRCFHLSQDNDLETDDIYSSSTESSHNRQAEDRGRRDRNLTNSINLMRIGRSTSV